MAPSKKDYFNPEASPTELLKKIAYAFDQQDTMAGFTDLEGKVAFANQSALRNVGATLEEVKGVPFPESPWRRHSPTAKDITKEMLSKALNGERTIVEDTMVNPQGRQIPAIFSISPIYDSAGKLVGLLPEGKDISDLKTLQKRLENERWVTRQWLDSMGALVAKCDPEGRVLACNRSTLESLGVEFEAIKEERFWNLRWFAHFKEGQERIRESILIARHGKKSSVEVVITLANGISKPFLFSVTPIMDSENHISFLALEALDISAQVTFREVMVKKEKEHSRRLRREIDKATSALRKSEQFSKNLVDSAPMGIIHLNQEGKVIFANPEIVKKLTSAGFVKNQIKGKRLSDLNLFPADDSWERIRKLHLVKGVQFTHERLIMRRKGKKPLLFEVSTAPLRDGGNRLRGSIVIMNDITERTRLEAELFKTRMQSEKLASLGQLIAGVAHEINNPLTSVIGCSEYLLEDCDLKGNALEAAEIIADEARRSGKIVKSLLAFARQASPEKRPTDIGEVIRSVLGIRMYGLKDMGIMVSLHLDDNLPLVEVDVNQIQQVVLNLINNAVDAIMESGIGDRVAIRTFAQDNSAVMIIEDNGPGISEKIREKIFDPFFTTKEPGKGTGLGLSISYGIIKQHGGDIKFASLSPNGARFIVLLPISIPKEREMPSDLSVGDIPSKVLVVDDEKNVCLSISNYLKDLGSHVDTALSGKEALRKLSEQSYDLMFVDLKMPEMDGLELYQKLAAKHKEMAQRFILMTGFQSEAVENYRRETGNVVLAKPFDRKEIVRTLALVRK